MKKIVTVGLILFFVFAMPCEALAVSAEGGDSMGTWMQPYLFETTYIVTADTTLVRTGPDMMYNAVLILYKYDKIKVRSITSTGWAKFMMDGQWRYVWAADLAKKE